MHDHPIRDVRINVRPASTQSSFGLVSARYVRTNVFQAITGYSANAVEKKVQSGAWREGREYRRAPDGHLLIDMQGYERWAEGQSLAE